MSASLRRRIEQLEETQRQKEADARKSNLINDPRVQEAVRDPFKWATQFTETYNEHWVEEGRPSPYEPFPKKQHIFALVFDAMDVERIFWWEKSRDMMLTWACVAYLLCARDASNAERTVLAQTQKEDKAVQLVDYAKCLYRHQPQWLQDAFPLTKPIKQQPKLELNFKNGVRFIGIPRRRESDSQLSPWGYLNDESSFQPDAGECYNEALAAAKGKIIFNSSAGPGWYADARRDIIRNAEE